jgi:short subunit dehydrogenase-like uncharacterized protein
VVEGLARPGLVRRDGRLVEVPQGSASREIDFGARRERAVRISWGDVFTAYHTTGIPNIEVYTTMPGSAGFALVALRLAAPLLSGRLSQAALRWWLRRLPAGPIAEPREKSRTIVWGEVRDGAGRVAQARLSGPDGYAFTAFTALAAANVVLEGKAPPGFQTPARAFGADWVLGFEGVAREDTP